MTCTDVGTTDEAVAEAVAGEVGLLSEAVGSLRSQEATAAAKLTTRPMETEDEAELEMTYGDDLGTAADVDNVVGSSVLVSFLMTMRLVGATLDVAAAPPVATGGGGW